MDSAPRFTYAKMHPDVSEQLEQHNDRRFEQLNGLVLARLLAGLVFIDGPRS